MVSSCPLPGSVIIPIIIAIALDNLLLQRVKKFVQITIYVPYLFSALVIIGIYINLLSPVGPFNSFMSVIGLINEPIPFFTSDSLGRWMLIYMTAWHDIGFYTLIYLAALTTINPSLYEAQGFCMRLFLNFHNHILTLYIV